MEVILLQKVANLGNIGDKVKVKPGYGRNFLLPQGKAALCTAANLKKFEERRAELEKLAADEFASAKLRAGQVRPAQIRALEGGAGEVAARQDCQSQVADSHPRTRQGRPSEVDRAQLAFVQDSAVQDRAADLVFRVGLKFDVMRGVEVVDGRDQTHDACRNQVVEADAFR